MNEAAKNISELLEGDYCKTILIADRVYVIKAPSIKVITRAAKFLSLVDLPNEARVSEMLKIVSEHLENIIRGLSYLIVGDVEDYQDKAEMIEREMQSGTYEELYASFLVAFELIAGRSFFAVANSAMELAKIVAKPKS